jgi:hypothetical protein
MEYDTTYYWQIVAEDGSGDSTVGPIWSFTTEPIPKACGDCNGDGSLTVADAIYTISYLYRDGPLPEGSADVNLDGRITSADAIYLVGYIYRDGPAPCEPFSALFPSKDRGQRGRDKQSW